MRKVLHFLAIALIATSSFAQTKGNNGVISLSNLQRIPANTVLCNSGSTAAAPSGGRANVVLKGFPIANESVLPDNNTWTTVYGTNTRKQYIAIRSSGSVRVAFVGFSGTGATAASGAITMTASLESTSGATRIAFNFSGSNIGTIAPGAVLVSDPVYANIAAGQQFWVWTHAEGSNVLYNGTNTMVSSWGEGNDAAFNVAKTDVTLTGTAPGPNNNSGVAPLAVIGDATCVSPYVVIFGDSIGVGLGDTQTIVAAGRGYLRRALNNSIPFLNIAESGMLYVNANPAFYQFAQGATDVVDQMGINDVRASESLATLQANAIAGWQKLGVWGAKVWKTTLTPNTSSTDTWATVANQSTYSYEPVRTGFNDWVRCGAPINNSTSLTPVTCGSVGALLAGQSGHPLAGYIEAANAVEVNSSGVLAQDGGRWNPGNVYTTDGLGLHPNSVGAAAIAAIINTAVF